MLTHPCLALAKTVSLAPVADTSLFELAPTNNLGAALSLVSGTNGQLAKSRALVKFDIPGSLPTNALITGVTLTMTVSALPGGSISDETTFHLHQVLQPWGEGNKSGNNGAAGGAGEATWKARLAPDKLWTQPGASAPEDFVGDPRASTAVTGLGKYAFESANLVSDVQNWLTDPGTNFGWILINRDESVSRSARRFGSRESDAPPTLLIQYVEESDELRIEEVQVTKEFLRLHLSLPAGNGYSVQFRDNLTTSPWQVLTNLPAQNSFQRFVLADPLGSRPQRFYQVEILSPSNQRNLSWGAHAPRVFRSAPAPVGRSRAPVPMR
ncbi:MAG: DNRLRE domain-containing protein [Verrucomicrobiales bacterium]|nr:DNRLRE domain-containing protein [Verrucomicrobiales bacterium]